MFGRSLPRTLVINLMVARDAWDGQDRNNSQTLVRIQARLKSAGKDTCDVTSRQDALREAVRLLRAAV